LTCTTIDYVADSSEIESSTRKPTCVFVNCSGLWTRIRKTGWL